MLKLIKLKKTKDNKMTFNVRFIFENPDRFNQTAAISLSTHLTINRALPLCCYTNSWLDKVMGSLSLVVLTLASVIEALVRTILAPLALLLAQIVDENMQVKLVAWTAIGALLSAENACNCIVALIETVRGNVFTYDTLIPCFEELNTYLIL